MPSLHLAANGRDMGAGAESLRIRPATNWFGTRTGSNMHWGPRMSALRMCLAVAIVALGIAAPAAAQQDEPMHQQLLEDLRKEEIQKQLIAAGSLDAPAGRASRQQLRKAIEWFRRAHKLGAGVGPLTQGEKDKLAD